MSSCVELCQVMSGAERSLTETVEAKILRSWVDVRLG
jgi:hypothetical protein